MHQSLLNKLSSANLYWRFKVSSKDQKRERKRSICRDIIIVEENVVVTRNKQTNSFWWKKYRKKKYIQYIIGRGGSGSGSILG